MRIARQPDGFSLVEVVLALGVATFCLLVLFALIPVGLNTKKETVQYTVAAGISSDVISDLRATPKATTSTAKSRRFQIDIPSSGSSSMVTNPARTFYLSEDGVPSGTMQPTSVYRVSVGFSPPATAGMGSIPVRIVISWPAQAYPDGNTWPTKLNDSYEVITSLDRS